jgi:Carbon-nitrogen hydrolase
VPLLPVEHSVTPHNVWDRWVELYGRGLDAFYPVADTEIGRLGFLMANEGSYPENARGLAMNGAEVVYRGPYPHPHVGNGLFEIQNRGGRGNGSGGKPYPIRLVNWFMSK